MKHDLPNLPRAFAIDPTGFEMPAAWHGAFEPLLAAEPAEPRRAAPLRAHPPARATMSLPV
jgi:hypothetical protein